MVGSYLPTWTPCDNGTARDNVIIILSKQSVHANTIFLVKIWHKINFLTEIV